MSKLVSVRMLQGDAEACLLADGESALQAIFPDREIVIHREWVTRPDWVTLEGVSWPDAWIDAGLRPVNDLESSANDLPQMVLIALWPLVSLPGLEHPSGAKVLLHQTLRAAWPDSVSDAVVAGCSQVAPLSVDAAIELIEPTVTSLIDRGVPVAISNAFRHVGEPLEFAATAASPLRERVRQLNLAIARLSQRTGCFVLDLDRPLAQVGAAALRADCFGGSQRAAELALDEFAALAMDAMPDCLMPLESE